MHANAKPLVKIRALTLKASSDDDDCMSVLMAKVPAKEKVFLWSKRRGNKGKSIQAVINNRQIYVRSCKENFLSFLRMLFTSEEGSISGKFVWLRGLMGVKGEEKLRVVLH